MPPVLTYQDVPPFRPNCTGGFVVKVVDGDTVHIAFPDHDGNLVRICCRLMGLDTAEIHSRDPVERRAAQCGKQHLETLTQQNEPLHVRLEPRADKYGRWLATLTRVSDSLDLNMEMLQTWAVPYDGKTKPSTDWAEKLRANGEPVPETARVS